jgi:hypothetical protein
MKKYCYALVLCCFLVSSSFAQITIGTADLPSAGDTFRVSVAGPLAGANYALTGPNQVWDFSLLTPQSQQIDTFLSVSATSAVFNVVFINLSFNPNRANVATRGSGFNLGTVAVSDVYNFYYNSNASYSQVGFGATISGIPAPFTYNPKDIVYAFPLQFADVDTSFSSYNVDLSSTLGLYFRVNRTRINQVDGWGTLITPYGTHNVLRVKTTITERDSVHIDSLNFGLNLPAITNVEYKWMANGEGVPLLQANANAQGNVNQVLYRDNTILNSGISSPSVSSPLSVFPNPAHDVIHIEADFTGLTVASLVDLQGKQVIQQELELTSGVPYRWNISSYGLRAGNYLLQLRTPQGMAVSTVVIR